MKELHIQIDWKTDHYEATILAPAGCPDCFALPAAGFPCALTGFTPEQLVAFQTTLLELEPGSGTIKDLNTVSDGLFQFLFGTAPNYNALFDFWRTCLGQSRPPHGDGLRLVLHLDSQRAELLSAPWELIRMPQGQDYLAVYQLERDTPHLLLRESWVRAPLFRESVSITPQEPLRVLLVLGTEEITIRALEEALDIDQALYNVQPWQVVLSVLKQPSYDVIAKSCLWEPHIFHFVGHGVLLDGEPKLVIKSRDQGRSDILLNRQNVADLFPSRVPRLVILNACRTAQQSGTETRTAQARTARGFAQLLIERGVPAVIAIQADIQGQAAALFMRQFYTQLACRESVDRALNTARQQVKEKWQDAWDWALPALHIAKECQVDQALHLKPEPVDDTLQILVGVDRPSHYETRHGVGLDLAVRLQVGYDQVRRNLEMQLFKGVGPPITLIEGEERTGKTILVCGLSECCVRRNRPFIYADFAGRALKYLEVLRLIRDGYLITGCELGIRLANRLVPDIDFNGFNYALNFMTVENYAALHPEPPRAGEAIPDQNPLADLPQSIAELGARPTEEGTPPEEGAPRLIGNARWQDLLARSVVRGQTSILPFIGNAFWHDLQRLAQDKGLIIFLDHVEGMKNSEVTPLHNHLLKHALDEENRRQVLQGKGVQIVVVRQTLDDYGSSEVDPWAFLARNQSPVSLVGFERSDVEWLARMWARRYFISFAPLAGPRRIKSYLRRLPEGKLCPDDVDALIQRIEELKVLPRVIPGILVRAMLDELRIAGWFAQIMQKR